MTAPTEPLAGTSTQPWVGTAPVLGLAEAAKACSVSESTLRRRRPELLAAGATRDSKGAWRIPVPALVELGLLSRQTPPDRPPQPLQEAVTAPATQPHLEPLLAEVRAKLAAAEQRAAVAEAVAEERERIIQAQAQTLRMLEAPKPAAPQDQPAPQEETLSTGVTSTPEAPKRRWWKR